LNDVFCISENSVIVVGNNGTILKTTDGGDNWLPKSSGTTFNLTKVKFANQLVGYVIGFNGVLLKTIDGGAQWNIIVTNTSSNLYGLSIIDENSLLISGSNGLIIQTNDGGVSFSTLGFPENETVSNIQFFGELNGYAQSGFYDIENDFTQANKLYKTNDGGLTWLLINDSTDAFYFMNHNTGFISKTDLHTMNKTTNGGLSFTSICASNIHEKAIFSLSGDIVWDLGLNPALCWCTNFCIGKKEIVDFSVTQETPACNNVFTSGNTFRSIFFINDLVGFMVGTNGSILKNGNGNNIYLNAENFKKNNFLKIYPNPATEQIHIAFNEKSSEPFNIEITDFLGKKVFNNSYQNLETINIDTKGFASGVYLVSIRNQYFNETQKIVIK
jgi:photosystem II stability/assembly factor-like uncharacterized protein